DVRKHCHSCNVLSLFQNAPSPKSDVFHLVTQDVSGIGQLLDYMYTSHLDITAENVRSLLDMAQGLQVQNLQSMCGSFLKPCPPPTHLPAYPVGGAMGSEHDCLLGNDVEMTEPCKTVSVEPEQTRPERQLLHGYKLRNFYSRQYFKQLQDTASEAAVNPELGQAFHPNPPPSLPPPSANDSQHFRLHSNSAIEPIPNQMSTDPVSNSLSPAPVSHHCRGAVRPKKTVYLKKYLRSQKALEEMNVETAPVTCPTLTQVREPSVEQPIASCPPPAETEEQQEAVTEAPHPGNQMLEHQPPEEPQSVPAPPTGTKQYRCSDCGKVFKHPSNLELHKRSHTGKVLQQPLIVQCTGESVYH
uniref:C2H2-type domain-containing protein n=1 Tax=Periophthalmus magnuspinnatus TaxID=409849 RepID=A0A3B3ZHH6_9GOBI